VKQQNQIIISDNFLEQSHIAELLSLSIEYSKVHWLGADANPTNPLHLLIKKTKPNIIVSGATAWYNIRPINPVEHSDIDSYCKNTWPKKPPEYTFLYYLKEATVGGKLHLENGEIITCVKNRLVRFPADLRHKISSYKGNRISIGIIWWHDTPFSKNTKRNNMLVLDRPWAEKPHD
jgi:hypothetical protein